MSLVCIPPNRDRASALFAALVANLSVTILVWELPNWFQKIHPLLGPGVVKESTILETSDAQHGHRRCVQANLIQRPISVGLAIQNSSTTSAFLECLFFERSLLRWWPWEIGAKKCSCNSPLLWRSNRWNTLLPSRCVPVLFAVLGIPQRPWCSDRAFAVLDTVAAEVYVPSLVLYLCCLQKREKPMASLNASRVDTCDHILREKERGRD